jgi:hypothetical protein
MVKFNYIMRATMRFISTFIIIYWIEHSMCTNFKVVG